MRADAGYVREIVSSLIAARDNLHRATTIATDAGLSHSDIRKLEFKLMDVTEAWALVLESYLDEG